MGNKNRSGKKKKKKKKKKNKIEKEEQEQEQEKEKEQEKENNTLGLPPPPNLGIKKKELPKKSPMKKTRKTKNINKNMNKSKSKSKSKTKGSKVRKGVDKETSELPMLRLRCNSGKLVPIKPSSGRWNAMVITDCHFNNTNESWFAPRLIPDTMNKLRELIKSEGVEQLITLGDIFHSKCKSDEYMVQIVEEMAGFGCEMFMIGGNHDRGKTSRLVELLPKKKYEKQIHIIASDYFMGCFPSQPNEEEVDVKSQNLISERTYPRVVFAHDAGNNYKLAGQEVVMFLRAIRYWHKWFQINDLFVTGHTHTNRWFDSENMGSLGPFHMGHFGKVTYGILKETESGGALKWNVKGFYP
ncbi:component of atp-dependent dsDNA exonuclease [Anaeramoeba flamelloides]|uniref:Component of atp-dependent dsDNA exonuclease n=1 Tax=Anaeramoeba flamelloides TaxID=1746091 RepID=A0AAV7ZBV2_9EUKA|nr:component of atp-dependent dsDNA exonuclease [Anaeramoeba flamelloides]